MTEDENNKSSHDDNDNEKRLDFDDKGAKLSMTKRLYDESIKFEDELLDDMIADDEIDHDGQGMANDKDIDGQGMANDKDNDRHNMDNDNEKNADIKISNDHELDKKSTSKGDLLSSELLSNDDVNDNDNDNDEDNYYDAVDITETVSQSVSILFFK